MKTKFETMLALQDKMNAKVNPEWLTAGYAWHRAIMVEGVEALEHFGWKWWKKQTPDITQAQIELVDIWHFVLSMFMVDAHGNLDLAHQQLQRYFMSDPFSMGGCTTLMKLDCLIGGAASGRINGPAFKGLMADFGLTWDSLYNQYIAKNVLNVFRQDHGYRTGTYIKDWNGREDNVVMASIMEFAPTLTPDGLYAALETAYNDVIGVTL